MRLRITLVIGYACVSLVAVACSEPADPSKTQLRVERANVAAQYDSATGRLRRLEVDTNKNGTTDTWTYMDGTRIDRIEIDRDENATIDRWEYYAAGGALEKVGTSSRGDGVVDEWAFQGPAGELARVESDTDRDGRIDKWQTFDAPRVAGGPAILRVVALDPDGEGRPTRRLLYRADGSFERQEMVNAAVPEAAAQERR